MLAVFYKWVGTHMAQVAKATKDELKEEEEEEQQQQQQQQQHAAVGATNIASKRNLDRKATIKTVV
jgi:hypothetical protein